MKGFKTWLSAIGMAALGIYQITEGQLETGIQTVLAAVALVGLGHKLEKSSL